MPEETYFKYMDMKTKMETDLRRVTGRPTRLTNPVFFGTLINLNENLVEVDLPKLASLVKDRRRRRNDIF